MFEGGTNNRLHVSLLPGWCAAACIRVLLGMFDQPQRKSNTPCFCPLRVATLQMLWLTARLVLVLALASKRRSIAQHPSESSNTRPPALPLKQKHVSRPGQQLCRTVAVQPGTLSPSSPHGISRVNAYCSAIGYCSKCMLPRGLSPKQAATGGVGSRQTVGALSFPFCRLTDTSPHNSNPRSIGFYVQSTLLHLL